MNDHDCDHDCKTCAERRAQQARLDRRADDVTRVYAVLIVPLERGISDDMARVSARLRAMELAMDIVRGGTDRDFFLR